MIIRTSSYAGWRPEHGQPVRITLGGPRRPEPTGRARWLYVAELAPRGWYFNTAPEKFGRMYAAQLERLGDDIERKLGWLAGSFGPLVLCCFERRVSGPSDCHRRAAAEWLEKRLGIDIPELDPRNPRGNQ